MSSTSRCPQQTPADHQTLPGELKTLLDCVVEHYRAGQRPAVKVQPRPGFANMSTVLKKIADGTTSGAPWSTPELLCALNDELVSVCKGIPRAYNGATWTSHDDVRVVPSKLSQSVFHTSMHTIQVPCCAWLPPGVTCLSWTETTGDATPTQTAWVAFKSDDGAWLRQPTKLYTGVYDSGAAKAEMVKTQVIADGTRFWVVNSHGTSLDIRAYDTNGALLGSGTQGIPVAKSPGFWDVALLGAGTLTYAIDNSDGLSASYLGSGNWQFNNGAFGPPSVGGTITISNATGYNGTYTISAYGGLSTLVTTSTNPSGGTGLLPNTAVITTTWTAPARVVIATPTNDPGTGLTLYRVSLVSGSVVIDEGGGGGTRRGGFAWMTNDGVDSYGYLAWLSPGSGSSSELTVYQSTGYGITHTAATTAVISDATMIDSLVGWVQAASPGQPTVNVVLTTLADAGGSAAGPRYDPALRAMVTLAIQWDATWTFVRQTSSVIPVSRAFARNGEYYAFTYYQSGSGLAVVPSSETVSHTSGDYFLGAAKQDVRTIASDHVVAAPLTIPLGYTTHHQPGSGNQNVQAGDTCAFAVADGTMPGLIPGTPVLVWTFANLNGNSYGGKLLRLSGTTGVSGANDDWALLMVTAGGALVTPTTSLSGAPCAGGTFGTAGTALDAEMIEYVFHAVGETTGVPTERDLDFYFGLDTIKDLDGGVIAMSGSQTIKYAMLPGRFGTVTSNGSFIATGGSVFVESATAQTGSSATLTPSGGGRFWRLTPDEIGGFDDAVVGSRLVVEDDTVRPTNNGDYAIISTGGGLVTDGDAILSEIFTTATAPKISVQLADDQIPYTFKLQALTLDYSYQDAIVSISSGKYTANNGAYKITTINADGTFTAVPATGATGQQSENLQFATVTIFKQRQIIAPWQPAWFITPLTGTQPQVGCFERGQAFADWRVEGDSKYGPTQYPMTVGAVVLTSAGLQVALPYRAESVTQAIPLATNTTQVPDAQTTEASTVGVKLFTLAYALGDALPASSELLLPGPMGATYDGGTFAEAGVNVALEAPFLVSQGTTSAGQLGLVLNQRYQYVAVAEFTTESGDRIFSPPSPPLNVHLTGSNNKVTLGGRLPFPLGTDGLPNTSPNNRGVTCRNVSIALYRTAILGDATNPVPTTIRFKITNDLNVNGLAPASALNPSGFSFPNTQSWTYVDANPDISVSASEELYVDRGFLPRYPMPAMSRGAWWQDRAWVVGYDGAIWFSGARAEGDANWWFPGFRIPLPGGYTPVAVAALEGFLQVICKEGIGYIPATDSLPNAAGQGNIPSAVFPPFTNGGTGAAAVLRNGVAYDSTSGGAWVVDRALQNSWLTQRAQDDLAGQTIKWMGVDAKQRLHMLTTAQNWYMWDQISSTWSQWRIPSQAQQACIYRGLPAYQDGFVVMLLNSPGVYDTLDGSTRIAISPDITFQSFQFGGVRGVKSVREIQGVGQYRGPHNVNVVISYPDDDPAHPTTFPPFAPDPSKPYLWIANPLIETAASLGLRAWASFEGISSPGDSFALEFVSFEVGVDNSAGIVRLPDGFRMRAVTP